MLCSWSAVLVVAGANAGQAQSRSIPITGTVTDVSGALLPRATISLEGADRSTLQTSADKNGHFAMEAQSGDYTLKVTAFGFATHKESIHLADATSIKKDLVLSVDNLEVGCALLVARQPEIEQFNASLTSTLPLSPLPPLNLHQKPKSLSHMRY
jgi:hypothetical protein